jgi:hypothetical protein
LSYSYILEGDDCGQKQWVPWQREISAQSRVDEVAKSWKKNERGQEL